MQQAAKQRREAGWPYRQTANSASLGLAAEENDFSLPRPERKRRAAAGKRPRERWAARRGRHQPAPASPASNQRGRQTGAEAEGGAGRFEIWIFRFFDSSIDRLNLEIGKL